VTLSLILCSRNDQYMGDSRWRLATALNYVGEHIRRLGRESDVEIVVADWGSDPPLSDTLEIDPAAARVTRFVLVPPILAATLQLDSPFPEVIALNAAARRARGDYIGRIDQDTLVGARFLATFFDLCEGKQRLDVPLDSALLFSGHRHVPYRLAVRCPPLWAVTRFVERRGRALPLEGSDSASPFYLKAVGIWLLHRRLWHECGGYDERMIYMNGMEANMIHRLMTTYPIVDLGRLAGHDFYHLEHYHPWATRRSSTHRKVNPHLPFWTPDRMNPNGDAWGLAAHDLAFAPSGNVQDSAAPPSTVPGTRAGQFLLLTALVSALGVVDRIAIATTVWSTRIRKAWLAVRDRPVATWPRVLCDLWAARRAARQARSPGAC